MKRKSLILLRTNSWRFKRKSAVFFVCYLKTFQKLWKKPFISSWCFFLFSRYLNFCISILSPVIHFWSHGEYVFKILNFMTSWTALISPRSAFYFIFSEGNTFRYWNLTSQKNVTETKFLRKNYAENMQNKLSSGPFLLF